jgi:uncharacterized protein YcnI
MIRKYLISLLVGFGSLILFVTPAFAHVIVSPKQVGIGVYQEFSMSVPTEKDNPTVGIKLFVPSELKNVRPNVKPGWTVSIIKKNDVITEIDWTGGSIPVDQRDDFLFQAQVPAIETEIPWKAIQTYEDGSTVEWTHDPNSKSGEPYSTTKVINDLTAQNAPTETKETKDSNNVAFIFSIVALALSAVALSISLRRKNS